MSRIELYCGDWRDVLPTLDRSRIAAVVTDPPYGMNWDTDSTRFSGGLYPQRLKRGAGRSDDRPILGDDEPFDPSPWLDFPQVILWGSNHYANKLPRGTTLVWLKRYDHLFGSFLSDAEIAWEKGGHGVYCYRDARGNVERVRESRRGSTVHPNQKPVGLMRWCLGRLDLPEGSTILDPFMGSGTTGVACMKAGHDFLGIEVNPAYFAAARRRIEAARPTLFEASGLCP